MDTNSVTGDKLVSKQATDAYRTGFDLIWKPQPTTPSPTVKQTVSQQNPNSKQ